MSKKKNKQERKKARHDRRVANRAKMRTATAPALKLYVAPTDNLPAVQTPTAPAVARLRTTLLLQSPMIVPHVHTARAGHPTWDRLLNHVGRYRLSDKRAELDRWVQGLLQPGQTQPALLLTGPECSGKTTFYQAMGLLLPDRAVVRFPEAAEYCRGRGGQAAWQRCLQEAWLMVVEGRPDRYVNLFAKPDLRGDRYLKWCLTHNQALELENVEHFEVGLLATTVPDLLNRLEDERGAFLQTFRRRAAA